MRFRDTASARFAEASADRQGLAGAARLLVPAPPRTMAYRSLPCSATAPIRRSPIEGNGPRTGRTRRMHAVAGTKGQEPNSGMRVSCIVWKFSMARLIICLCASRCA
jgi:hypothetical protein